MFDGVADQFAHEDILEPALLELAEDEENGLELFLSVLRRTESIQPSVILTTCSIYTRHLPAVRRQLGTPVLGVDEPMLDRAARIGGRIAVAGSLKQAIALTAGEILGRAKALGVPAEIAESHQVGLDDAAAPEAGRRLAQRLREIRQTVDVVVVAQLSLAGVADHLEPAERDRILTSPGLALTRLRQILSERRL